MNRIKGLLTVLISVLLMVLLGSITASGIGTDELETKGHLRVDNAEDESDKNHLYCVHFGQGIATNYYVDYKIKITDTEVQLWSCDAGDKAFKGSDRLVGSIKKNDKSNKFAAIFSTDGLPVDGSVTYYYKNTDLQKRSGKQLVIWCYWNKWLESLPKDWQAKLRW